MVGAGVKEEVEDMHKAVKYSSISSFMLKPFCLPIQVFDNNSKAHKKLFKKMCNLGTRVEWR